MLLILKVTLPLIGLTILVTEIVLYNCGKRERTSKPKQEKVIIIIIIWLWFFIASLSLSLSDIDFLILRIDTVVETLWSWWCAYHALRPRND